MTASEKRALKQRIARTAAEAISANVRISNGHVSVSYHEGESFINISVRENPQAGPTNFTVIVKESY